MTWVYGPFCVSLCNFEAPGNGLVILKKWKHMPNKNELKKADRVFFILWQSTQIRQKSGT
jgi:hypothetical protein